MQGNKVVLGNDTFYQLLKDSTAEPDHHPTEDFDEQDFQHKLYSKLREDVWTRYKTELKQLQERYAKLGVDTNLNSDDPGDWPHGELIYDDRYMELLDGNTPHDSTRVLARSYKYNQVAYGKRYHHRWQLTADLLPQVALSLLKERCHLSS